MSRIVHYLSLAVMVLLLIVSNFVGRATPTHAAPTLIVNVNSTTDASDANPGNGVCATSGGVCTLRAAIEETNARAGMDTINVPAGTYLLDHQLVIEDSLFLTGAGRDSVLLDGQNSSEVLQIRTVELLVCDSGNDSVASYDRNGQRNVDFLSAGAGDMHVPGSIAVASNGDVLVSAYSSGVHRFSSTGQSQGLFVDPADYPGFAPTDGIFGDYPEAPNLDFYVTDYYPNNRVLRMDRFTGDLVATFVTPGSGGLEQPNSLAFYNDDLFVTSATSNEVLRYDGDTGDFIEVFASTGLDRPRGLAFRDNTLYVASESNDTIVKYNANTGAYGGAFVAAGSGGLDAPTDLTFGPDGNLYVISKGTKDILRFNGTTGAFIDTFVEGDNVFLKNPACLTWRTGAGEGPIVNIAGVTLRNGKSYSAGPTSGLNIDRGASVSLRTSAVRDNHSSIFGGGIQNWGILDLIDVEVTGNALPEGGGGQTSQGGGIFNAGNLEITRSLIANNFATRGGGISNVNDGRIEITNSTISGNTAFGAGGGIRNAGEGRVFINHSTITNNSINGPGSGSEPSRLGGGIYTSSTARVDLGNSIVAGNSDNRTRYDADYAPDCYSQTDFYFTSRGNNVIGVVNDDCNVSTTFGDDVGTDTAPLDPHIGPLSNGVHTPQSNSPAVDAGSSVADDPLFFDFGCRSTDQRGNPRPIDGDIDGTPRCDAGAAEYLPPSDGDGIDGDTEDGAPNNGDGNNDGIPDRYQPAVASLPAPNGAYLTLISEGGTTLQNVSADQPTTLPFAAILPLGELAFGVDGLSTGQSLDVTLLISPTQPLQTYYQFGPTSGNSADHWYEFADDGATGAEIDDATITLHFKDGQRGDHDGSADGRISARGGPALILDNQIYLPNVLR